MNFDEGFGMACVQLLGSYFWRIVVFIHPSREEKTDEGTNYHC